MDIKSKLSVQNVAVFSAPTVEAMQAVADRLEDAGFTETNKAHPQLRRGKQTVNFHAGKSGNKIVCQSCDSETLEIVRAVLNGGAK